MVPERIELLNLNALHEPGRGFTTKNTKAAQRSLFVFFVFFVVKRLAVHRRFSMT